jgi:hypothetical protein
MRLERATFAAICCAAIATAFWIGVGSGWAAKPEEQSAPPTAENLVGLVVDVTLSTGETIAGVKIVKVAHGRIEGSITSVTIDDGSGGRPKLLGAVRLQEIAPPGGRAMFVYDAARKVLVPPDQVLKKRSARLSKTAEAESHSHGKQPDAKDGENRKALAAKGVNLWPALSDEEQRAVVEKQRAMLEDVKSKVPNQGMRLYETKRFLFFSDISPQMISTLFVPQLDQMYVKLCWLYGMDTNTNIFRGKAVIVAYANKESFVTFEDAIYHNPMSSFPAQGLAHQSSNGDVLISCYLGSQVTYFASVLVHETAHGFTHRFKSSARVPSWLNEGISDWVAGTVVTQDNGVRNRVRAAVQQMQSTHSLGGDLFAAEQIAPWQYGVVASMVDFLVKYTPPSPARGRNSSKARRAKPQETACFHALLEGIKEGTPWVQALQQAYGMTPEELAQRYGEYVGVADLKP